MRRSSKFPNGVAGHVVAMTLDHTVTPSQSVATCGCGQWQNRVEWRRENHPLQDAAIELHWGEVSAGSTT